MRRNLLKSDRFVGASRLASSGARSGKYGRNCGNVSTPSVFIFIRGESPQLEIMLASVSWRTAELAFEVVEKPTASADDLKLDAM
jgi:hypothetical protein